MAYTCTPNSGSSGYNGSGSGLAAIGSTSGTAIAAWGGTSSTCVWTATGAGGATATYRETVTTNTAPGVEVVTYIHTDGLGSPVARSDANGNLIAGSRTRYEPYGATSFGAIPTIGFTGHVNDANTGLVYMQQRYYDPVAGRFLSTDPVLTDGKTGDQFNRYAYANNNPYKYIDPDGRIAETPWDAFNVALGATSMAVNLSSGNYGRAAVDAAGLVLDSIATAVPAVPGGAASVINATRAASAANAAKPVVSRIKESSKLVKEAEKTGKNEKVQAGVDKLTSELKKGNLNPGIGSKPIGQGLSEARHDSGARVYFREKDGAVEILGKSGKDNQQTVIKEVLDVFGR
jgi:RHS repeat-associated protein